MITGTIFDDLLEGSSIDDLLIGLAGSDTLIGFLGDDTLSGGSDNDIFEFDDNFGQDVIADFELGSDRIDLSDVTNITDFDDLLANHIDTNADGALVIFDGDNTITLNPSSSPIDPATLTADDFIF